jgi:hypothetical protein
MTLALKFGGATDADRIQALMDEMQRNFRGEGGGEEEEELEEKGALEGEGAEEDEEHDRDLKATTTKNSQLLVPKSYRS